MPSTMKHLQCAEIWGGNRFVETQVELPGLDAWVYSKPASGQSGGDVHYLSSCASGQFARILLADVAGHGERVSETAEHLRNLMRRYVIYHSQIELARAINRRFARFSRDGSFATALIGTFDAYGNHFSLTNAGHPPPARYDSAAGDWSLIDQRPADTGQLTNVPLGIERRTRYEQFDVRLNVGDLVLWYTDSLTEARNARGELLGAAGLLPLLRRLDPANAAALVPGLRREVAALHPANLTEDDVTALLMRPNGHRPFVSLRRQLLAPIRQAYAILTGYGPEDTAIAR